MDQSGGDVAAAKLLQCLPGSPVSNVLLMYANKLMLWHDMSPLGITVTVDHKQMRGLRDQRCLVGPQSRASDSSREQAP